MSSFKSSRKRRLSSDSSFLNASPASSIKSSREMAAHDELKLLNEQLQDELNTCQDEMSRVKEKSNRQLSFLEEENARLKELNKSTKELYYEEKSKWQAKLRDVAEASSFMEASSTSHLSSMMHTSTTQSNIVNEEEEKWSAKLESLERGVQNESNRARELAIENANLKEKVRQLQKRDNHYGQECDENSEVETGGGDESVALEYRTEARELRKRCSDLEIDLRKKSRELDRVESKLKNQSLLEAELSTASNKAKTVDDTREQTKAVESQYLQLQQEREAWINMFKDILGEQKSINNSSSGNVKEEDFMSLNVEKTYSDDDVIVSPEAVVHTLREAQQKCAVLIKEKMESRQSLSDATEMAQSNVHKVSQLQKELETEKFEKDKKERSLSLIQQQASLYEGEISSLRSLVRSFDTELSLGKPDVKKLLGVKDELISQLRTELDACRQEAKEYVNKVDLMANTIADSSQVATTEKKAIASLKEELYQFKCASGLDYLPSKTKVLHLVDNPVYQAYVAKGQTAVYDRLLSRVTIPKEALKQALQEEKGLLKKGDTSVETTTHVPAPPVSSVSSAVNTGMAVDSNKLNMRLKEMFKGRIQMFREAVYLLTGFKIDMIFDNPGDNGEDTDKQSKSNKPLLRVRNMYAEQADDSLLFQWHSENKLNLMETEFAQRMKPELLNSLQICNSVPVFLSAVTSELFDNQTFMP